MKVLHITCFDNGGAGIAAVRLHKALLNHGVESKVLVLQKRTSGPEIYQMEKKNKYVKLFQRVLKKLGFPQTLEDYNDNLYKSFPGNFEYFSFAQTSYSNLVNHPLVQECDVINLHWIANFLDYKSFFKYVSKPIVWTQHDMSAFQGGFHYKEDDVRNAKILSEVNNEQYQCKLKAISGLPKADMHVVSPSKWMMSEASSSEILGRFEHHHIPNGIDPNVFYLKGLRALKEKFGFKRDKITVLLVSETVTSRRKGFDFIKKLVQDPFLADICEFVAVGKANNADRIPGIKYMGSISSEIKISEIYGAADIYLLGSREDNLPNVLLESLASGTPVVAFAVGGMKDLVIDGFNGFLSKELSTEGLRGALLTCIRMLQTLHRRDISNHATSNYNLDVQAKSYIDVYKKLGEATVQLSGQGSETSRIYG